jgi:hypothetical protein
MTGESITGLSMQDATTPSLGSDSLPYATPSPQRRPSALAGAALLAGGLGLILLGGCFLVGVMMITERAKFFLSPLTPSNIILISVLYVVAFACFIGAALLVVIAARGLIRLLYN